MGSRPPSQGQDQGNKPPHKDTENVPRGAVLLKLFAWGGSSLGGPRGDRSKRDIDSVLSWGGVGLGVRVVVLPWPCVKGRHALSMAAGELLLACSRGGFAFAQRPSKGC